MSEIKCQYCGGTAGIITPEVPYHFLCEARAGHGLPTPSLGDQCPDCGGSGVTPITPMVYMANVSTMPKPKTCHTCKGKGCIHDQA